jgi:hypothetical protein
LLIAAPMALDDLGESFVKGHCSVSSRGLATNCGCNRRSSYSASMMLARFHTSRLSKSLGVWKTDLKYLQRHEPGWICSCSARFRLLSVSIRSQVVPRTWPQSTH